MAKLQKLMVAGIRSFGPGEDEVQQIKFNDTVTLFLGQNGCGKTTILEAIRYALTGEVPAGCGGGAGFVNDPSLNGRMETKGQVRLKVKDITGKEIIIIRSNQVTKTRNGALKFTTLDSSVNEVKNGERNVQFSGRCADIKAYCAEAIQVSPCILNNVLLCHQENSSWPLDEAKKLKEKFDEIFDSTQYNKSVDLLRKAHKSKKDRMKLLQRELEYKKENHQRVEKEKLKLQDKKNDLQSKRIQIDDKKTELTPIEARLDEIFSLEDSFGQLEKVLASKEATKKGIIEQQNTIKRNINEEFTGSDEELNNKIRSFENDQYVVEKSIRELDKKKQEVEKTEKETNTNVQKLQMKMGQLKEEKRQYEQKCVERRAMIEKVKVYLRISSDISDYDVENNTDSVIDTLKEAIEKSKEDVESQILEKAADETILQNTLDEIREKQATTKQISESKCEIMKDCEKKVREITNHLHDLRVSDSQLEHINTRIEVIDKTINSLKTTFNEDEFAKKILNTKSELEEMEKKKSQLDQEYRLLQKNSVLKEKLDSAKETIVHKETEVRKLKSKHSRNFEKLFSQNDNIPELLKEAVTNILEKEEQNLKKLQSKLNEQQKQVTTLESTLQHQTSKLRSLESDLHSKKKKVQDVCKGKNFEELLEQVRVKRESLQRDKAVCTSLKVVYEKFIAKFQENNPCCPVCKTDFTSKARMVNQIISELKNEIENVPKNLPKFEQELQKVEEFYNKMQQLKPIDDSIEMLSNAEIPLLQENLDEIKSNLKTANDELISTTEQLKIPQEKIDVSKNLITDAAFIDQHQVDIKKLELSITDVESQLVRTLSDKSVGEIEAEIDTLELDITDLRKKMDTYKAKLDQHRNRLQDLRESRNKLVERQLDFQSAVQGKPEKEKQLTEYKEKVEILKAEITELNGKLQLINNDLKEAVDRKNSLIRENKKVVEELRNKVNSNSKLLEDIIKLHTMINQYIQSNKNDLILSAEKELEHFKQMEESLNKSKNVLTQTILNKKEELAKQESRFRELKDNVTLREKQKEENVLNVEILELKKQIGEHNITTLQQEKRNLECRFGKINREINNISGQYEQIKEQVKELESELNKPTNKNAFDEYRNKFYEVTVESSIIKDLEKYTTALEKSIIEFHKDKMKQINKSIRELWRNIYRGNDIDYIEIKTEVGTGTMTKRAYNYKVVQVKRGAELEMRGRCSAGQKVLACLVIRMALAEIFSSKCGILALDEPTTNLDRENIASLSDALSRIVVDRQQQANFQLLIITHDEDFLDTLTRVQSVSSYYRVKRNESGFSIITKEHLG